MATIDWTPVEEAEQEGTLTSLKLALLESDKVLSQRLAEERVPGGNASQRLEAGRWHFTRPERLEQAVKYVEALKHGHTPGLTKAKAKEYLQAYRQGVADLNQLSQSRDSWRAQAKLYLGMIKGRQRWLLRILGGVGVAFILIMFLSDTGPGQALVDGTVGLVHLFFGIIVGLLLIIALLVLVVIGSAVLLDRRSGGRVRGDDE